MHYIDAFMALITIAFGAFGFLAPRYTAAALDLKLGDTTMGLTELRASVGGLFVIVGLFCLVTANPAAYGMLGVIYTGAALGRGISIVVDAPPRQKALLFFALEAGPAAWLLGRHLSALL